MPGALSHAAKYAPSDKQTRETALLCVGFAALALAVVAAHRQPATGYEVSVYASSPVTFWAGLAVAIGVGLVLTLRRPGVWHRAATLVLLTDAFLAVVAVPLLRGYEFSSSGDALSHVGWVRNVLAGDLALTDLIYPGLHTLGIYFHRLFGADLETALMLAVVTFTATFAGFVAFAAYTLTGNAHTAAFGLLSALFLPPVNNISAHLTVFPSTMAVFFLPLAVVLTTVALRETDGDRPTPVDVLLALTAISTVFIHPQQAVNLLIVFVTVSLGVLGHRYLTGDRSLTPLYWHSTLLAGLLLVWALVHERISETAASYAGTMAATLLGEAATSGGAISQRTGSLSEIGASPLVLGGKLFLTSAVFALLAAGVVVVTTLRARRSEADHIHIAILGLGIVPVGVVMVLYVLGDLQTIYFRHLGFIMTFVTIFGAIGVAWTTRALSDGRADVAGVPVAGRANAVGVSLVGLALAGLLALSLVTLYPSPFIYQGNSHVTEMRMDGHATAFAHENESVPYLGVRTGPDRFRDAIEGTGTLESGSERRAARVPYGSLDGNFADRYDSTRYLVVSTADVERESVAYRNLRYSERGLQTVDSSPGVDRLVSNGDFRLFRIAG